MSYISVLVICILFHYSVCSLHSGEDHSSEENHDIPYERDGWRYASPARTISRQPLFPSPTLKNILEMIANGFGRQQISSTPLTEDCAPNGRPSPLGFTHLRPSQNQQQQTTRPPQQTLRPPPQTTRPPQQTPRPPQTLSEPFTNEKPKPSGPSQPYRPQGGWGVQLMDPMVNITQLLG